MSGENALIEFNAGGKTCAEWLSWLESLAPPERASEARRFGEAWIYRLPIDTDEQARGLFHALLELREQPEMPGLRLRRTLLDSLRPRGEGVDLLDPVGDSTAPPPAFPSTVDGVEFRGLVTVAGDEKLGKSTLCVASALEAALDGWLVLYANAELDAPTFRKYIRRWIPDYERRKEALSRFYPYAIGPGVTAKSLVKWFAAALRRDTTNVLIVLDSVNRIADMSGSNIGRSDYFGELKTWTTWAMQVRKETDGDIALLFVSEKNTRGGVLGRNLVYASDVVLNLSRAKTEGYVDFHQTSRYARSGGLGAFFFDWRTGRFEPPCALPEASNDTY